MGSGRWDSSSYSIRTAGYATKSRDQIFQKRSINKDFDPVLIECRESCDSDDNPNSTAIIVGLDVTGSMGMIAEHIARNGLGTLVDTIYEREPVTDPHLMFMAIGDITCDNAPLQVTQFEADERIADQLEELWLEGGGGGNRYESYDLPWAFAARKTKIDCFDKHGRKGYLFTIGDEEVPRTASRTLLKESIGVTEQTEPTAEKYLEEAQSRYHVFHIVVEEGSHCRYGNKDRVIAGWREMLDKRVILLKNHKYISEVITAVIEVNEGADPKAVIAAQQGDTAKDVVDYALFGGGNN